MKKFKNTLFLSLIILLFPLLTFAQANVQNKTGSTPTNTNIQVTIPNPTNAGSDLMAILRTLLDNVVMPIASVAVVVWIIWAGFTFVLAQGKPAEIEKAKQRLLWSLIGAGILLGAVGISKVVELTVKDLLV